MKTFIMESAGEKLGDQKFTWYFIPDSALCNSGKPFFIPRFADRFEAYLAPVVRINRLGKSIAPRFVSRYFAEWAPAVHFRAPELRKQLMDEGLPADMSYAFDRSLIVGDFAPIGNLGEGKISLFCNGEECCNISEATFLSSINEALSEVSQYNTIKMGDFLIPLLSPGKEIKIGNFIEVRKENVSLLEIPIR